MSVRTEKACIFDFERLRKRVHALAVVDTPDLACVVRTGTDEKAAVGAESHIKDGTGVPFQRTHWLAGDSVPDLDFFVVAACGQPLAIGRELRVIKRVAMAFKAADECTIGDVPDRRDAPQAGDTGGVYQPLAIRGEMQGGDLARKSPHRAFGRT